LTTGRSIAEANAVTTTSTAAINPSLKVYNGTIHSLPASVGSFVIYIVDEAHENTATASWKHISDHNPTYIPTNLVIHKVLPYHYLMQMPNGILDSRTLLT